jgi:hypothetical protein
MKLVPITLKDTGITLAYGQVLSTTFPLFEGSARLSAEVKDLQLKSFLRNSQVKV